MGDPDPEREREGRRRATGRRTERRADLAEEVKTNALTPAALAASRRFLVPVTFTSYCTCSFRLFVHSYKDGTREEKRFVRRIGHGIGSVDQFLPCLYLRGLRCMGRRHVVDDVDALHRLGDIRLPPSVCVKAFV